MKRIRGSFIEIEHPNRAERVMTHDALSAFSEEQWQALVEDTAALGMDTLVLLSTALRGTAYFPFEDFPFPDHIACRDAIEAILGEADKTGQAVFVGVGFYGTNDSVGNSTDPAVIATALRAMDALFARYGHHPSFSGWYIADEWCIWDHIDERFIAYINTVTAKARALCATHKVIVAPFGTHCLQADDMFVEQLSRIEADIIAYQDEIGVKKMPMDALSARFAALREAHDKANGPALWVDTEIFDFAGDVYRSALIPATIERLKAQLNAVSPYVDKVIVYTYQGLMSRKGSPAALGGKDAEAFYEAYGNL
ncbi:MAG: DUF4434 domain-containing protein [Clostridia bacterium]|nr:DUF4434 domain-containing protein [Clostridia bacterium]